jgi:phage terminase large subunit
VFIDFNPVAWFWAHEMEKDKGVTFIRSTYLDNNHLDKRVVQSIENRKDKDPNWWRVYGLGLVGMIEGLVFNNWQQVDTFPDRLEYFCGLDFGYTNDPTALVKIGVEDDIMWIDELIYQTGLKNPDIARMINSEVAKYTEVYAESAEPKSIDEIYAYGVNIHPAKKGKDSILNGIDVLHRYNIRVTKRSTNLIKELRNYTWLKDKEGRILNKPIDAFNHAIDALRYGAIMKLNVQIDNSWVV